MNTFKKQVKKFLDDLIIKDISDEQKAEINRLLFIYKKEAIDNAIETLNKYKIQSSKNVLELIHDCYYNDDEQKFIEEYFYEVIEYYDEIKKAAIDKIALQDLILNKKFEIRKEEVEE